jgi:putative (di)nucleoside polyphosphate hydrolase
MFELIKETKIDFTIDINPEFDEFIWCSYWYPLSAIVEFKKEVYRSVLNEFCMASIKRYL